MNKLFNIFAIAGLAMGLYACEETPLPGGDDTTPPTNEVSITLNNDKDSIVADGVEAVTFAVEVTGESQGDVQIICLNDNSVLPAKTFTTTTAGEYQFKAILGKVSSNTVTITATAPAIPVPTILLEADKESIVADNTDTVTFTVKVDGQDKTSEVEIINLVYNVTLEDNTFATDVAGEFTFKAKYEEWESNEVKITATAPEAPVVKSLRLDVAPNRIKADGTEEAVFTVYYGEDDVTNEAEIYNTATQDVLPTNKFSTTEVGTHSFRARYNDEVTGVSTTVDAYDPNWEGKYEPGTLYNENGIKGVIFAIKEHPNSGTMFCYVMSMDEEDLAWSNEQVDLRCANSPWGAWITSDIFHPDRDNRDINDYPAFKWCVDHGDGWFLPSQQEMQWMWEAVSGGTLKFDSPSVAHYNKLLSDNGGEPFVETYYWSSTGLDKTSAIAVAFMEDSVICLESTRDKAFSVRAAYRFAIN